MTPGVVEAKFPTLLDFPAPRLRTYPRETVVAEKFEAVVRLGIANTRMKDFYDLWAMATTFAFDGESLAAALGCRAFYDRRRAAGDPDHQALRALGNRLVGYLHGCLRNHTHHDEAVAWGHHPAREQLAA